MSLEHACAEVLAQTFLKSAGEVEPKKEKPTRLRDLPEVLSVRGKRQIDYATALGLLGSILGGASSLLYGNKAKDALKHALMGGGFGAATGFGFPVFSSKTVSNVPGPIKGLSDLIWSDPEKALYFSPKHKALVEGPDYRTEWAVAKD